MTLGLRLFPVVLLWGCVIRRWPTLRQGHTQRALWATLATCAAAATIDLPAVAPALDRLTGAGSNVAHLVKHCAVLVAAAAAREVVRGFAMPSEEARRGAGRRLAGLAAADSALTVLFVAAPVHGTEQSGLTASYATDPVMGAYWAVYLAYLGAALVSIVQLTRWYLRHAASSPLRTGLSAIGLGALVGLGYMAHKGIYILLRLGGVSTGPIVRSMEGVSSVLLGTSIVLLVAGVSWPTLAQRPRVRRMRAHRAYHRLHSMWKDLTASTPAVEFSEVPEDIEDRLYDRAIEIRDGSLAVRPYAPAHLVDQAREVARELRVAPRHLPAATEAALLELARRRKARGEAPARETVVEPPYGGGDFDAEVQALLEVARQRKVAVRIADRVEAALDVRPDRAA